MDGVVRFVESLAKELEKFKEELDSFEEKLLHDKYSSLFYKACVGSADAYFDERIEYIKNIFIYGLRQSDLQTYKVEGLLNLLNRVTDIEIVYLRFYYLSKWDMELIREYRKTTGIDSLKPNIQNGKKGQVSCPLSTTYLYKLGASSFLAKVPGTARIMSNVRNLSLLPKLKTHRIF